jgi:hypothetical protein
MEKPDTDLVLPEALQALSQSKPSQCTCALKHCQGWESVSDDRWPASQMQRKGTLRAPLPEGQTEPSFEEFHPDGTRYDSPQAPIAPTYFPYNRCDVFACTKCGCGVLKYTEYGGYYVDHRVRLLDPDLVINPSRQ